MNSVNIIFNGQPVTGSSDETILQLAHRMHVEIPTLCNDPRLDPFSSCYVCVVEVEGMRGLQPSCSTKLTEGMSIVTESNKVNKARKTALDLLLSNHYADCAAPCKQTCPAGVDVQGYISLVDKGLYSEAIGLIKETNPLPAICGRVCVRPCELACRRNLLDEGAAVGIDYIKRFAADKDMESDNPYSPELAETTGKRVAIIGAGPGGLSAAWFLQLKGHQCDIYEAAPYAGGWLRYGIPEYRLPNDILDAEVRSITDLGVNIYYNQKLGDNLSYDDIKSKYDSTILTIGSQRGTLIGCEGDDAGNVFSGIDFLRNMQLTGKPADFSGKTVAVVGGGNTAMDCCRTSMRCGAEKVYVIYRRTEKEMPANPIEIHESKLEGIEYLFLTNPSKVNKDENGDVKSVTCLKMELGEPDASGRRRPVPIEGSDYDLPVNYILAAIGQKTEVNFIDNVNEFNTQGELKINRWGDIEVNRQTLQTGIDSMFAAGDGVSGPATIIEAVAQAKTASLSCHQYLMGEEIAPAKKEFLSKKDNFKTQESKDYIGTVATHLREEMPVLDADKRNNFEEVELGYANEEVAQNETSRCLECGCTEIFTCDLKKYATEYGAEQEKFAGEFNEYKVDFSHPKIEIDSNKCILCARCVRICTEMNGAGALGLIDRGYKTYVAPALGGSLCDTDCDSCGLCISACPTGAITENFLFKPGPIKTDKVESICNFCSIGCSTNIEHKSDFVMKVTGREGLVNTHGSICKYAKFGYSFYNDSKRIVKPLVKKKVSLLRFPLRKLSTLIADKIKFSEASKTAFFAGARLTNEELFLIKKLSQTADGSALGSFAYLGRDGYETLSKGNVSLNDLSKAKKIYIFGSSLRADFPIAHYAINLAATQKDVPVTTISTQNSFNYIGGKNIEVKSYYSLAKALNYVILSEEKQNNIFIDDCTSGFEEYKKQLLSENIETICTEAGLSISDVKSLAYEMNDEYKAVIVFNEKELSSNACNEIANFSLLTGKSDKSISGIIDIKEKNNSHGLIDLEISSPNLLSRVESGDFNTMFIFGEDPIGCAVDKEPVSKWFENNDFVVVQDSTMTETAALADVILPTSFAVETGGSYTNNQKYIQQFDGGISPKTESGVKQLAAIISKNAETQVSDVCDVRTEMLTSLTADADDKYTFVTTNRDNYARIFNNGCDSIQENIE